MKKKDARPKRLHGANIVQLASEPLVGMIALETNAGVVDLAINRLVAQQIADEIAKFLRGESETLDQMRERLHPS